MALGIPRLPTDNLYKLLALSGVVIYVVALIIFFQQVERTKDLIREITVDVEALPRPIPLMPKSREDFEKDFERIDQFIVEYTRLKTKIDRAREQQKLLEHYSRFLIVVLGFGAILAIVGFSLWYTRVQRYQDIILKGQAAAFMRRSRMARSSKAKNLRLP